MSLQIQFNSPWLNVDKPGTPQLTLDPSEQRELLDRLADMHGVTLVGQETGERILRHIRRKPVAPALRVARYLEGRRGMPHLDPEEIHSVWVNKEDASRDLTTSDLQALLDYIREA